MGWKQSKPRIPDWTSEEIEYALRKAYSAYLRARSQKWYALEKTFKKHSGYSMSASAILKHARQLIKHVN